METDAAGVEHSYLADEANFQTLRNYEVNNLLVPLVGDFGGNKALRTLGQYLRDHGATVTLFYTSNVEQYLSERRRVAAILRQRRVAADQRQQHAPAFVFQHGRHGWARPAADRFARFPAIGHAARITFRSLLDAVRQMDVSGSLPTT